MKFFFGVVLFFLSFNLASRQLEEIDSLSLLVLNSSNKHEKLQALNRLTFLFRERELDKALGYGLSAESLALELKDSVALGRAKGNLGWIHYRKGNWNLAFRYSKDAYLIGLATKDDSELAMVLNNLGALYYQQSNFQQAISYFKEAYKISVSIDDTFTIIRSLNNIALNFSKIDQLDSALFYANEALLRNEKAGSIYFTSFTKRVIGDVLVSKGEINQAIEVYNESLFQASHQRLSSFESSVFHRLGKAYFLLGQLNSALDVLEKGKKIAEDGGFKDELVHTYYNLYLVNDKLNDQLQAFHYLKKYEELNRVMDEQTEKDKLKLIQGMFEVEKADAELMALKAEANAKRIELRIYQRAAFWSILFVFLLIALTLWVLFINQRKNSLYKKLLTESKKVKEQKIDLEHKSQQLEDANQTKNRLLSIIGHDLKAPVNQLRGVLQLLADRELTKTEFDEVFRKMRKSVDDVYSNLDNILFWSVSQMNGFQVNLDKIYLIEPILSAVNLLKFFAEEKNILIQVDISDDQIILSDRNILTLIVRNLLSNSLKFSVKYSVISITSTEKESYIYISIKDSGTGMNQRKIEELKRTSNSLTKPSVGTAYESGTGLGYNLINELLPKIGGSLDLISEEGLGTEVIVKLPASLN